jgi:hypothetical protein
VVTGCYASHAPDELKALSPRVEVYSNKDKENLPACLGFEVAPDVWGFSRFAHRARAFVKIQDGCKAPLPLLHYPSNTVQTTGASPWTMFSTKCSRWSTGGMGKSC